MPLSSATSALAVSYRSVGAVSVAAISFSFHQSSHLLGGVVGRDAADGARARAHHDRLRLGAGRADAHAAQEGAARDARGGDEHVLAGDEIVRRQDTVEVVTR